MKPISHNPAGTIGFFELANPISHHLGSSTFKPSLLKEWTEMILVTFGDEPVYLSMHPQLPVSGQTEDEAAMLLTAAMEKGDELQIGVVGTAVVMVEDKEEKK